MQMMRNFRALALLAGVLSCANAMAAANPPRGRDIGTTYRKLTSPKERMNLAVEAIDRKIICQGCDVKALSEVFGVTPEAGSETTIIRFERQPKSNRNDIQVPYVGWYLVVEHHDGVIENYYLTNTHK